MAFSLALWRHRLAARRGGAPRPELDGARPPGRLLRAHLSADVQSDGTARLLRDLVSAHPDLAVVVSGAAEDLTDIALRVDLPRETPRAVRAHLDRWAPDAMLFSGPDPHPVLWAQSLARRIPLIAVEADPARHPLALIRPLAGFDFVHARGPDPRLQVPIHSLARLARTPPPPGAIDSDLEDMSALLASRPTWLAAMTPEDEFDLVLAAHADAAKLSHRLLLILELSDPAALPDLRAALDRRGQQFVTRSDGDDPLPDTQVLVADEPGEIGLWARVASLCYLGGSLTSGPICDPMIPASLGSVIVHGPKLGAHERILTTLDRTRGARLVGRPEHLGTAIESLLSPERAAEIAHEAWDIATRGAEASNLALQALEDALARKAPG
ncbi:hypothetical protein ILP92_10725 [Maribius pontilimi]|uniref:3-deoxy-D-manno-octulosonic acid transferase n=1 Tax=Palleronia pontilimi TaxID=1964209 RepID=A0A934MHD3_9RHOB|nr:hypothetical protein [Palleronia pontilimi]MBJ3763219.1 hypothetical protein [Palleronia pontilimi]